MRCIYSDFCEEKCTLWDEDTTVSFENYNVGWTKEGICVCEDDPDPFASCENFEPVDPTEYEEEDEDTD